MDNKALKTGIFYNKNILCDTLEQPVDVDFTLPDYCPDISKIFKCKATARITSKGINGGNVTIDGMVVITLLYCDKDNKICSFEYNYPFSKSKETSEELDNANLCVKVKCDYINCRAVTGRKVDIHGAVSMKIRVFKRCTNQIVSDYDGDCLALKRIVAPATVPMGYREKYLVVEEEINLSNTSAPIINILRYDAVPTISECRVINDKAVVKGEMAVAVIYSSDTVSIPQIVKQIFPFSQIVEIPGVTELCKCDVVPEMSSLEIKPFAALTGDSRSFSLNAKILLKCESYCVNDIAVIEDAFSTKYQTQLKKDSLEFSKICENLNEKCHFKKNLELSENITSVVDIWGEIASKKAKFQDGKICVSAVILVGMMVFTEDETVVFYEKSIDFEWNTALKYECENPTLEPNIDISALNFTILTANCLEIRGEISISGAIYEKTNVELISDMTVDTQKLFEKNKKGGMVICFLEEGSCVWDIARKYNANTDEIMKINGLDSDDLCGKKSILVPIN